MRIKIRFLAAALAVAAIYTSFFRTSPDEVIAPPAHAQSQTGGFAFTPLGFCVIAPATSGSAVAVSSCAGGIPTGTKYAFIRVEQNMRWRDDGTAPTASTGQIQNSTDTFGLFYSARLSQLQYIAVSTGGNVDITFYGGGAQ